MEAVLEKAKVLIVDDNPNNVYSFKAILRGSEVELIAATSGESALQLLLANPDVSLILMDAQMPGMDGFETTELIRGQPKFREVPILFITAVYRSDEFARRGFEVGASDYITKPVDGHVLSSKVDVFLTLERQKRQLAREIAERKRTEERLEHLNRVLRAIRGVNLLIVRERNRDRLIQTACDILVETRGYHSAWVGLLDKSARLKASSGSGLGSTFTSLADGLERGELTHCAQLALARPGSFVIKYPDSDCLGCPLQTEHSDYSALVSRLEHDGTAYGTLTVATTSDFAADPEEQRLFNEIAGDLGFALRTMTMEDTRAKLEQQLLQSQKMESVGRLAGGVAHDFNNLLTTISGYGGLVREQVPEGSEVRQDIDEVLNAANRAAGLTRQLLAFSRRQVIALQVISLSALIANMTKMLQRLIGEDVELITLTDTQLDRVRADPGQIEQVLLNLVVNARDAMPMGGQITIETQNVTLDDGFCQEHLDTEPGEYVMLAVTDTGVGMTDESKAHLFEPFYTTKEEGKGTGLGLSTSYGIVKQHQGTIGGGGGGGGGLQ